MTSQTITEQEIIKIAFAETLRAMYSNLMAVMANEGWITGWHELDLCNGQTIRLEIDLDPAHELVKYYVVY